ncbi:EAL domain-containing protein [Alicyclobacillus fodiniaquatilis]|uniref:EAL domain-containing protein n=1 Tax=Alicyclobacillus fodiniaquatilis TaxID=1661150 RepID=A0ABW4JGL6_9BACL
MIRLRMAFQPIHDIRNKRIIGYEALMRPKKGQSPLALLQRAQKRGNIVDLDESARRLAVKDVASVLDNDQLLFLNTEPESLESIDLWQPWPYNIDPSKVVIEITERSISEAVYPACDYLHELGVNIALDDFGVGTSNLWMVDRFKPHFVKADRSFLGCKAKGNALEALVSMTSVINAQLIVEGVETETDVAYLHKIGVKLAQGFYLGVPTYVEDLLVASHA